MYKHVMYKLAMTVHINFSDVISKYLSRLI